MKIEDTYRRARSARPGRRSLAEMIEETRVAAIGDEARLAIRRAARGSCRVIAAAC